MRPAQNWNDYELIDATAGNRLERWDKAVLVRPDPQVVWKRQPADPRWQQADGVYHRSAQGGGRWEMRRRLPEKWTIRWGELTLVVSSSILFNIICKVSVLIDITSSLLLNGISLLRGGLTL